MALSHRLCAGVQGGEVAAFVGAEAQLGGFVKNAAGYFEKTTDADAAQAAGLFRL